MSGLLIALEAIDRAGKTTAIEGVAASLRERGLSVAVRSLPDRSVPVTGPAIERFLRDVPLSTKGGILELFVGQALFCLNRREVAWRTLADLESHDIVLVSRSALAGQAYAIAGGIDPLDIGALQAALEWDVPRPSLVILLDLDPERVSGRFRAGGLDRFERDHELQLAVRAAYLSLCATHPELRVIDADADPVTVVKRILEPLLAHRAERGSR